MNYCILLAEMPASGKTSLGKQLASALKIPMFSKDHYKEILYDSLGFSSREEKVQLGIAALKSLYYTAEKMMIQSLPFILENNFEDTSLPDLLSLLEQYNYQAITLRLTGQAEQIYERFARRDLSPERHRGHVVNTQYPERAGEMENPAPKTYRQFMDDIELRGYNRFQANGPLIEVDVTDLDQLSLEQVIKAVQEEIELCETL